MESASVIDDETYAVGKIDFERFHDCPNDYKHYVIRIISVQAYAELLGANEVAAQLKLAPDFRSRKGLARIAYDEATHAYLLYEILEKMNVSESEALAIAQGKKLGSQKTQSLDGAEAVGDADNQWIDLVLNNMLMDRAGSYMVGNFSQSSFQPWAEACKKIYVDEQWHKTFGIKQFEHYIQTHDIYSLAQKFSLWYARALNFFGPAQSKSDALLKAYGIKRKSNEELRTEFKCELQKILADHGWDALLSPISHTYPFHIITN